MAETVNVAKEAFNTKQACKIIEATARQVRYWDERGLVKPSISPAYGRGSKRLYSYADLLALKTVASLRIDNVSLQKIRRCVSFLRGHLPDISQPLNICVLVASGDSLYLVKDEKTLIDTVRKPGQHAFRQLIDIALIDRQLRPAVLSLVRKRVEEVRVGQFTYQVEVAPDEECGGYVAEVAGLPGCITDGDTIEEVLEMARDAIKVWEEAYRDLKSEGITVPRRKMQKRKRRA